MRCWATNLAPAYVARPGFKRAHSPVLDHTSPSFRIGKQGDCGASAMPNLYLSPTLSHCRAC